MNKKNTRPIYRRWYNSDEDKEYFLLIHPSGLMLEISVSTGDKYGEQISIYQTNPSNKLNSDAFKKNKWPCTKAEFETAQKKALNLIKGDTMNLILSKRK